MRIAVGRLAMIAATAVVASSLGARTAYAQESPSPSATPAPTPTNPAGLTPEGLAFVLTLLIVAAVISVLTIVWFNREALSRYYNAAVALGGRGIATKPIEIAVLSPGAPGALAAPARAPDQDATLSVTGPMAVSVGGSADYTAKADGQSWDVAWKVEPPEAGVLNPQRGSTVAFAPARAGTATVTAEFDVQRNASIQVAIPEAVAETTLPVVARGFGTLVLALAAIFVVAALGLAGALGGEALATFFGAVLGVGAARAVSGGAGTDT